MFSISHLPEDLIYELLHKTYGELLFKGQVLFSVPRPREDGLVDITITPTTLSGLTGEAELNYSRLDLGEFFLETPIKLFLDPHVDFDTAVVNTLMSEHQLYFDQTQVKISTVEIPGATPTAPRVKVFFVTPDEDHLVWQGQLSGVYEFSQSLPELLPVTNLNGFDPADFV